MLKGSLIQFYQGGGLDHTGHTLVDCHFSISCGLVERIHESTQHNDSNHQPSITNHTPYQLNHARDEQERNTLDEEAKFFFI